MTCYICGKPIVARKMCSAHYNRWKRHGDPRVRVLAPRGQSLAWLKQVRDIETDECVVWPFKPKTTTGYPQLWIGGKLCRGHSVMCEWINGPRPDGMECAHSCGNSMCVNPRHLRWATPAENNQDKWLHGTAKVGEDNHASKLTEADVRAIREMFKSGANKGEISRRFGTSRKNVAVIVNRLTWTHVD